MKQDRDIGEVEKLRRINAALIERVERSMDQQGNAFSLKARADQPNLDRPAFGSATAQC